MEDTSFICQSYYTTITPPTSSKTSITTPYPTKPTRRVRPVSAYQEMNHLLVSLKRGEISEQEVMNRIQLRETQKPPRPYCKVTHTGEIALFGISEEPIILNKEEWEKLTQTIECGYVRKYIKYNESYIHSREIQNEMLCSDNVPTISRRSMFVEDNTNI